MTLPGTPVAAAVRPPQGAAIPVVHIVDDDEEVVRDPLANLLRALRPA